jgi:hypothetical protein
MFVKGLLPNQEQQLLSQYSTFKIKLHLPTADRHIAPLIRTAWR